MAARYPTINEIFNELDAYRDFCREFGHVFDEAHLYNYKTAYGQFDRYRKGQRVTNNWKEDRRAFNTAQRA